MKRLMILAAASATLLTAACGTTAAPRASASAAVAPTWVEGANAQPLEASKTECRAANLGVVRNDAFANCMATKGWTRG